MINFKNPFNKRSEIEVDLQIEKEDNTWKLLLKKKFHVMEPNS